ncbi:ARL14 effector protein [Drosophila grimshawi]|uniref:GH11310 n=1 Tax=Drosophila grimshawi TaxID=7222 RepID=B4JE56_DROGR|nr:ARL14 effector protein [Drosophila grimshawi]EDW03576.1 GH11310 [Drosophila grimshawi]
MSARSLRERPQRKETTDDNSATEAEKKRKGKKKGCYYTKNSAYDLYGNIRYSDLDVCDCMNDECSGCWYECRICGSTRCGPQCRVNRKFFYETIVYDGKDLTISNKHLPGKM